ncbi:Guanine nucleotide-binding protein alpha-12 subunit [Dirofilaria immitis]
MMTAAFALCCGRNKDEQTRIIEKQLQKERKQLRRQVKILLLGSGESGKSTFIKQMVIINGRGEFTADEVRAYRQQIYQNIIAAMRVLLDARQKLGYAWKNPEKQKNVDAVMRFTASDMMRGIDQSTFAEIAPLIRDFWEDVSIKQTYDQRNLFQISDSCMYFFEHINRIAMPNYCPTNRDILFCRKATRGITEHVFDIERVSFRFIDVGGQRSQRQKWFQCFEGITSILFMVASCEYDQVILEDRRTNRIVESRSVFETIANNKSFANVSIILFMNKSDLLEEKVSKSDIRQYFADFIGDHNSLRDVQFFLVDKFEKCRHDKRRPFFYHFTTAIDTENIRRVFKDCRETILEQNLKALMMQ